MTGSKSGLNPNLSATIDAFLGAMNDRDEAEFAACLTPDVRFFGSMTGVQIQGMDALKGMFRMIGNKAPGLRQRRLATSGGELEAAVQVEMRLGEDTIQGLWVFRGQKSGLLERISVLYNIHPKLLARLQGTVIEGSAIQDDLPQPILEPGLQAALERCFQAFNGGDENGYLALIHPEVTCFDSRIGKTVRGPEAVRERFIATRQHLGRAFLHPIRTYGRRREVAVWVQAGAEGSEPPLGKGVWAFRFDEGHTIDRISLLWGS